MSGKRFYIWLDKKYLSNNPEYTWTKRVYPLRKMDIESKAEWFLAKQTNIMYQYW